MDLNSVAAIAKILGVGMQAYDFINKLGRKQNESDAISLLCIMYEPTYAWKSVHLEYCALRHSMKKIYAETHNTNGIAKRVINAQRIQTVFQEPNLYRSVFHLENDLRVPMEHIDLSFSPRDFNEQMSKIEDVKIRSALQRIKNTKNEVVNTHKEVCEFFKNIKDIIDKQRWDDNDVAIVTGARRIYKSEYEAMIDYTDSAVMGMLDIYEVAFEALSKSNKK